MNPFARDYGSHRAVLRALLAQAKPKSVLEFGAGLNSTPEFLARPELERLVSIEPDKEWRRTVARECKDQRLVLRAKLNESPSDFDFVFIDDGQNADERVKTINLVLSPDHPLTVIHDADVAEYQTAIKESAMTYCIIPTDPPTAVCW